MSINYVTTTELREQSSRIVAKLISGEDITLIHRSKMIGVIKPLIPNTKGMDNIKEFKKALLALKPKTVILGEKREKIYSDYLKKRYGKSLS